MDTLEEIVTVMSAIEDRNPTEEEIRKHVEALGGSKELADVVVQVMADRREK